MNNFEYDFKDKRGNVQELNRLMLAKTLRMFEWQGLPDTIPHRQLETLLQRNGYAFITEVNGELYAFSGGLGGVPDVYGQPTQIVIANPALNFNATLDIASDGVMILNDDMRMGIQYILSKHNSMIVENDINLTLYGYNTRMTRLISAADDATRESAQRYVNQAIAGEVAIVGENMMFDGVKVQNTPTASVAVTQLIELGQNIRGIMYNELGISSNTNLKRERLVTGEVEQNEDSLFPLVYNMMACRSEACELLNTKYNIEVDVDFGSIWADKHRELVDDVVGDNTIASDDSVTEENPSPTAGEDASENLNQEGEVNEHILENNPDQSGTSSHQSVSTESGEGNNGASDNSREDSGNGERDDAETVSVELTEDDVTTLQQGINEVETALEESLSQSDVEELDAAEEALELLKSKINPKEKDTVDA